METSALLKFTTFFTLIHCSYEYVSRAFAEIGSIMFHVPRLFSPNVSFLSHFLLCIISTIEHLRYGVQDEAIWVSEKQNDETSSPNRKFILYVYLSVQTTYFYLDKIFQRAMEIKVEWFSSHEMKKTDTLNIWIFSVLI